MIFIGELVRERTFSPREKMDLDGFLSLWGFPVMEYKYN
jgi:hypothetical protein